MMKFMMLKVIATVDMVLNY